MELIITEKPSVARVIAEVVGATERQNGYLQGKGFLVSWCVGHLVELALPRSTMPGTPAGATQICRSSPRNGSTPSPTRPKSSLTSSRR